MEKPSEPETASLETQGSLFLQINYTQLRSFHAVAGTGGFTAASKVLHVGQTHHNRAGAGIGRLLWS